VFFAKKQKESKMGYPNMEKMPKGATSSDRTGEKSVSVPKKDKEMFHSGASGEKVPMGSLSSDMSGERKMPIKGGVGMGKADNMGMRGEKHLGMQEGRCGEMNTGSKEHVAYEHSRMDHVQDKM